MAPPAGTLRVGRYFLALVAILAVLYSIVFWPGARHTPKLGIDLAGGQQVVFTAKTPNGKTPSSSQMQEAKQIMTERVNGSGVTESTVVIQGSNQLVVSIPGSTTTDVRKLGAAAQLNLRGVVMPAAPEVCTALAPTTGSSSAPASTAPNTGASSTAPSTGASSAPTAGSPASPNSARERPLTASTPSGTATPAAGAASTPATTTSTTPVSTTSPAPPVSTQAPPPTCTATPFTGLGFTVPTTEAAYDALTATQQSRLFSALGSFDCGSASSEVDNPKSYFIACDDGTTYGTKLAYLLGPVIVPGTQISSASAQAPNVTGGGSAEWTVALNMKATGQKNWANYTGKHNIGGPTSTSTGGTPTCGSTTTSNGASSGTPCADYVAFTLDGVVISAPVNQEAINGGATQISGSFTQTTANQLATQLKYGALPLSFTPQNAQQISATLGSSQLKAGLLAGGIGLILVVIYSLIYYRALGLVTIGSLLVSGALTYGCLVLLGTQIGFTLSLAGIAGFIVAIGITADSFVVFFERIKDEVHEGRSMRVAIPRAWVRARRTILSADTVSFLAAAILYYFAAGDVRGFAFTLGLSTVLDLAVVFLFTHPLISVLSRSRAFGSARFTGLNSAREGGVAISDAEISVPVRARRTVARAASGAAAADTATEEPGTGRFAGVTVLDRRPATAGTGAAVADSDASAAQTEDESEPVAAETGRRSPDAAESDDEPVAPAETPRSTPAPGSAAERAAARRARMRAQGEQKGDR